MRTARAPRAHRAHQRGVTMVMVLLLLSVMLLGGLALARITEAGTLATGNNAYREASLQASEVGVNSAYAAVKVLSNEDANTGNWYWASMQTTDAAGIPAIAWDNVPETAVGSYKVRYIVERMCSQNTVTDVLRQCLVKMEPKPESATGRDLLDPQNSRQFRITVRVTGPKDTETWVQSLITKG